MNLNTSFLLLQTRRNKLKKYKKHWNKIKNPIETINDGECNFIEPVECKKDFLKVTFESDNHLPLGKILGISGISGILLAY